ncbi:FAD-dependent oxidoreductase, partial [Desulfovibrio piger]|uniref:FAD-dependent oxidoreductase n=1 Tax=Desulfovibrio piger TaxID=901 RepID=UPI0026EFEB3A
MKETTVIIIGGGATGIGILRDLSMRGVPALLLEQGGLAHGTSSRFHGLLHSGARYAVSDSESARECIEENMILRRIGRQCVEETEGFFVRTKLDDPAFEPRWVEACARAGITAERIDVAEARRLEPSLAPNICSVYRVPDSCVDGFRLVGENALCARRYGGDILTYHE